MVVEGSYVMIRLWDAHALEQRGDNCNSRVIPFWHNYQTNSARSATLGDTRWVRLQLASWNLLDSKFCSEFKTEPNWQRHRTTLGGGVGAGGDLTSHRKKHILVGGTSHILFWCGEQLGRGKNHILGMGISHILYCRETIWVGTPHNIEGKSKSLN